jgi:DNA-binding SARP family transcriptional activator/ABC-type branched-subunit amino acid transport system substrate-binding protein/DNA-binding beta-propeller fold protein YncE
VDFRILGPLEVREGEREVPLGRGKQRALLALLLLHRDEAISTDRIADELWGERPPPTAAKIVQNHVLQLRRALEDGSAAGADLVTRGRGYMLRVERGKLDLDTFQHLVEAGERALGAGEAAQAAEVLREALALWRGPPLADFAYEPFAQAAIARLEELRLAALERRIEADLALGRHADVVGELKELVSAHPLREGFRAQLMLALYRSGRQAEALEVYREARRSLVEELGIDPSPALQELEQAILRQELPPAPKHPPAAPAGRLPARAPAWTLVVVGGAVVAAAVALAVVRLTGGDGGPPRVEGSGVASIDASTGRVASFTQAGRTPSNVAVGEDAVWVLDADDRTISQIDPQSGRIVKSFSTGTTPKDILVGGGALWIGNTLLGRGYTGSVSRIDPASTLETRTLVLRRPARGQNPVWPLPGVSQLAIGAGSLWAINPDGTVTRFDAETGEPQATVPAEATSFAGIAFGTGGVWVVGEGPSVTPIDPKTNRPRRPIRVNATGLAGIAAGAGSVWAAAPEDGLVWRIEPGAQPPARTISVGRGVVALAFGEGALWAANYADGTIARIDPATNEVTRHLALPGNVQGIAAGAGSAWVSVVGGTSAGPLSTAACGRPESDGTRPDVLIVSDFPLQGGQAPLTRPLVEAIRFVLRRHGFQAGRYAVGYQSCDDATAQADWFSDVKCMANARAYAAAEQVVGVIGPYNSDCAQWELPITNRAPTGPVPVISPTNTYPGLTRSAPSNVRPEEPGSFYPTGVRHYFRLVADDGVQGAAAALLARQLGLKRVYVLDIIPAYAAAFLQSYGAGFEIAARKLGLRLAESRSWEPGATSYAALAEQVAGARPDGVYLTGLSEFSGSDVIKALDDRLGAGVVLLANETFNYPPVLDQAGSAAEGMYITQSLLPLDGLGREGKRLVREFAASQPQGVPSWLCCVPETMQAVEVLLQAIARSDGTRKSVLEQLRQTRVENGVLGSFRFDARGDISPRVITVERVERGQPNFDRLIPVPATLLP